MMKTGTALYVGNHQRSQNAGLGVDLMITFLPAKTEPILLE
jgi:hypothetical protein